MVVIYIDDLLIRDGLQNRCLGIRRHRCESKESDQDEKHQAYQPQQGGPAGMRHHTKGQRLLLLVNGRDGASHVHLFDLRPTRP
jgi:hypothetical protein